jgi:predicted alpha/beta-fold hydrolase
MVDRQFFASLLLACCSWRTAWQVSQVVGMAYCVYVFPWGPLLGLIAFTVLAALYYYFYAAGTTRIYTSATPSEQRLLRRIPCVRGRGYYPTPYLVNPNIQTLFAAMGRPLPPVEFHRQLNHDVYPDGEVCIVDWAFATAEEQQRWETRNVEHHRAGAVPLRTTRHEEASRAARRSFRDAAEYLNSIRGARAGREKGANGHRNAGHCPFGTAGPHSDDVYRSYLIDKNHRLRSGRPPVVIIFHGLTGGHEDVNVYYVAYWLLQRGWHVVVPVRRGCADCPSYLSRPKHYAYGGIEDTAFVVNHIADSMPGHPIYGVGLSAGSNVVVNYMAIHGRTSRIFGAVSVANGYCWDSGTAAIRDHHPVWDVIMTHIVNSTLFDRHKHLLDAPATRDAGGESPLMVASPVVGDGAGVDHQNGSTAGLFPADPLSQRQPAQQQRRRPRTMREYDETISKNLHGFDSLHEFYVEQSCVHRLHRLKHPVIFLNSLDDPLAAHSAIPYDALLRNPHTLLVCTPAGGHLGWATGWWPFRRCPTWMDTFIVEALNSLSAEALHRADAPIDSANGAVPSQSGHGANGDIGGLLSAMASESDDETNRGVEMAPR